MPRGRTSRRSQEDAGRWARRIDELVTEGSVASAVYNEVCSGTKVLISPSSWADSTFSDAAVKELLGTHRIFTDLTGPAARRRAEGGDWPTPCEPSARTAGSYTLAQVRGNARLSGKAHMFFGNWVVMRRAEAEALPAHVTVCGFYDCGSGGGRSSSGSSSGSSTGTGSSERPAPPRVERLVKHMNLCRYAKELASPSLRYVASGSFAVGTDGPGDGAPELVVNARSGSWALAKAYLYAIGRLDGADASGIDGDIAAFAAPKVRAVVARALRARPVSEALRSSGRRRTSRS